MMRRSFIILLCFSITIAHAQDTTNKNLDEVFIFSSKFTERKKNVVQKIEVVTAQQIATLNAQNTGDLLTNTGNVFVQKSQQGGSSPVIRGFEASRVLLVIDGIRMNNAIYRSGHLQNVITIDQNMLEGIEILYGPASTLYGSDALGGVIHMRTKLPALSATNKNVVNGSAFTRYSSANNETTFHADLSLGGKKFGWLQSHNYSDFDDLRMGDNYPDKYPYFGRRSSYITMINNVDSIVKNDDDRVQKFSGYSQWDVTQKFLFKPSQKFSHILNLQYSSSSDIPRYDRLQDVRNGMLRYAEWYYGPQERQLAAYEMNIDRAGFFNNIKTILSYQHIEESRHQREYRQYDRRDNRYEKLNVYAVNIDGRKMMGNHELTTGVDAQWNDVRSTANRSNIFTEAEVPLDTRYPNGENKMNFYGVYAQHIAKFSEGKLVLNDGLRLQSSNLHSTIADNTIFNFPFTEIDQENLALTGNIGIIYMPEAGTRMTIGFSSGFRAPNIDDAAKIFESNTASRQIIVPNENIKPERTYNIDLGLSHSMSWIRIELSGFRTSFRDAIALAPAKFNGQDSINYNGTMVKVFSSQNINQAVLYGFNAAVNATLAKALSLHSTINYTKGTLNAGKDGEVPLDHIPPVFGKTGISYNEGGFRAEAYSIYNGWKKIKNYNPSGEDNAQYATPEGTPSWFTLNLKASVDLGKHLLLQGGIENILDRNYRHFGSGFSSAGRNIILALRAKL